MAIPSPFQSERNHLQNPRNRTRSSAYFRSQPWVGFAALRPGSRDDMLGRNAKRVASSPASACLNQPLHTRKERPFLAANIAAANSRHSQRTKGGRNVREKNQYLSPNTTTTPAAAFHKARSVVLVTRNTGTISAPPRTPKEKECPRYGTGKAWTHPAQYPKHDLRF